MPDPPQRYRNTRNWTALAVVLALGLAGLRGLHLSADLPTDLAPDSAGLYVDEGYKTLAPRNRVLFGADRWHRKDAYQGWMNESPLTQLPQYALFRLLGPSVETARLFPIACLGLLLLAFLWGPGRHYPPWLRAAGVLALGLEPTLFFVSRTAIFEMPLTLVLYGSLFALARSGRGALGALALVGVTAVVAAASIKLSALLYFMPAGAAILLVAWIRLEGRARTGLYLAGGGAAVFFALFLFSTRDIWIVRLDFSAFDFANRILLNPSARVSFPALLVGLLCLVQWTATDPKRLSSDPYRASLAGVAVLGPLLVALFAYDPLRYYVPILPAYLLLTLEWVAERAVRRDAEAKVAGWTAPGVIGLLTLWGVLGIQALGHALLGGPWLRLRVAVLLAALGAVGTWFARSRVLSGQFVSVAVSLGAIVFALHTGLVLGRFALAPGFQAREARADLARIVPRGASVAGDWAPFFALGTDIRALYLNDMANPVDRIGELRPDYFLFSETVSGSADRDFLSQDGPVRLGAPVLEFRYIGSPVILYPLGYDGATAEPEGPAPDGPDAAAARPSLAAQGAARGP